jgi:hypothetical protein
MVGKGQAMGLIKGFTWDLFISYARNDDPETTPWVTRLVAQLRQALPQRLGSKDLKMFFDKSDIRGPGELDPKITAGVKESAFFVALLSRSYVMSDWCIKELKYFLDFKFNVASVGFQCSIRRPAPSGRV